MLIVFVRLNLIRGNKPFFWKNEKNILTDSVISNLFPSFIFNVCLTVIRGYICTVVVLINGKISQRNVKNRQGKLKSVLKELVQACSINKIHDGFTHHSLYPVTHCPVCSFHNDKISGISSVDFTGYFITVDYDGWCPKEV